MKGLKKSSSERQIQLECVYRKISIKENNEKYIDLIFILKYTCIYTYVNILKCVHIYTYISQKS